MRFIGIVNAFIIAVDVASDSYKIKGSLCFPNRQESVVGISIFTTSLRSGVDIARRLALISLELLLQTFPKCLLPCLGFDSGYFKTPFCPISSPVPA